MSGPSPEWSDPVPGPEWPGPRGAMGRVKRWWVVAAVLILIATAVLALRSYQESGDPQLGQPSVTDTVPAPSDGASGPAPVALRIPALGVDETLITLGLNPDETVEAPTDFDKPGWYKFGPAPGQLGSAVILGHVDSYEGPAVFYRLKDLEAGDSIEVSLADGTMLISRSTRWRRIRRRSSRPRRFTARTVMKRCNWSPVGESTTRTPVATCPTSWPTPLWLIPTAGKLRPLPARNDLATGKSTGGEHSATVVGCGGTLWTRRDCGVRPRAGSRHAKM